MKSVLLVLLVAFAAANKAHPCKKGALKIAIYRDAACARQDPELTKEHQAYWDQVDTATCKDMGSDAGYSFDYACEKDGFHTAYYSGETCNTSKVYQCSAPQHKKTQQQLRTCSCRPIGRTTTTANTHVFRAATHRSSNLQLAKYRYRYSCSVVAPLLDL